MLTSEHIVAIAILDFVGICLNIALLYTIKERTYQFNAIDVLQIFKTVFVLIALVVCVWMELFTCSDGTTFLLVRLCSCSKAIADDVFFHSTCWSLLSVAYIRQKVCGCRGRASVLVTPRYACKNAFLCLTPVCMFAATTLILIFNKKHSSIEQSANKTDDTAADHTHEHTSLFVSELSRIVYDMFHLVILNVFPIAVSIMLYVRIFIIVKQTAHNTECLATKRRHPTKLIAVSIIVLLSSTCSVWAVYIIIKLLSLFNNIKNVFFIYLKLLIFIVHPIGEGIFQTPSRKVEKRANRLGIERTTNRIYPSSPSSAQINGQSLAVHLPMLIEEKEIATEDNAVVKKKGATIQTSNDILTDGQMQTSKERRDSISQQYRPSILINNAAFIGLECRDKSSIIDIRQRRRESEDRLQAGLRNIDSEAEKVNINRTRILSKCLRLSSSDDLPDDEQTEIYKLIRRRGLRKSVSKTISVRSEFNDELQCIANDKHVTADSIINEKISHQLQSSPRARWNNKRFHKNLSRNKECKFSKESLNKIPEIVQLDDFQTKDSSETSREQSLSAKELSQDVAYSMFAVENQSFNSLNEPKPNNNAKRSKGRSISCVNNEWLQTNVMSEKRERKKSQPMASSKATDSHQSSDLLKSISCDAHIYLKYRTEKESTFRPKRSIDSTNRNTYTRYSRGEKTIANGSCLLDRNATRKECIDKLLEMKDYF